jgi:hypothetical protein
MSRLLVALALARLAVACPNGCSGAGYCAMRTCTCYAGFMGADCSLRTCPKGPAWADEPSSVDVAHAQAECSNMGLCDRKMGVCKCEVGFIGAACQRTACQLDCSGHGRCISLKDAAREVDDIALVRATTYETPWDAEMIYGCACDYGFSGVDCSIIECIRGDDPVTTGQVNPIQTLTCSATSGYVWIKFRDRRTAALPFGANAATIKSVLEALPSIYRVNVAFTAGSTLCSATPSVTTVEFLAEHGAIPVLRPSSSSGTISAAITQVGTKESEMCNQRGLCDVTTGVCLCDVGYGPSNGQGLVGHLADCGNLVGALNTPNTVNATQCPGFDDTTIPFTICSGNGICESNLKCACYDGFAGYSCAECVAISVPALHALHCTALPRSHPFAALM